MTIQDGKSEKAGPMVVGEKITRKRPRGFTSSLIIPTEDENLAHTLVMLRHGAGADACGDIFSTNANDDVSDEEITKSNKCFKCDVCGKDFLSYQALGGHKASHRPKPADDVKIPRPTADSKIESAITGSDKKAAHVCPKCGKSFTKGQSLGGHMRLHYDGTKNCKIGTPQGGGGGGGAGRDSNCSILSSVITPSVSQESGCGGSGSRDSNVKLNYIGSSEKEGQEIGGLDLELRLGREIQVNKEQQKPKKKPRFSLTLALDNFIYR